MRAVSTLTAIGVALCLVAGPSHALGFGRVANATQLGQPLNFSAVVRLDPDETLARDCVSAEVQSGDNKLPSQQVRVTLEGGTAGVERNVRVTTSALIDEPVVTVSVTVGCNSKVTRRFVAFVDPPLIDAARTAQVDAPMPSQRIDSATAPVASAVPQADEPRPARARSDRSSTRARQRTVAAVPASAAIAAGAASSAPRPPHRQAAVAHRAHVAQVAASGPRLQLDATPAVSAVVATAASEAAVSAPLFAAASVPQATSAPLVAPAASGSDATTQDHQRLQALEVGMAKMRSDAQATQSNLAALQARLTQAESDRYANPMVYALAFLSALLAIALAAFWWRGSRQPSATQWWAGPASIPAAAGMRLAAEAEAATPRSLGAEAMVADPVNASTVTEDDDPVPPVQVSFSTRPAPFVTSQPAPLTLSPELPRELSVEELIDLEQQAEFFIVLGQDEAAIELLMSHVRSDGGISPLPYLKLLEIYRRRGEEEAYQRIRERFNRRFNSYAPDWESDMQQGRALVDYPEIIVRLQALWSSSVRVMETLDASLFRRNGTDETFDLPAYRELLFLYSVARDLAEHAGALPTTSIDLLLPLDARGAEPIARLNANNQAAEFKNSDMMTLPLDLDVSFGPSDAQDRETLPAALRRPEGHRAADDSNFIDFDLDAPYAAPPRTLGGKA